MLTSSEQSSGTGLPTAEIRLVDGAHYRRDAFAEGLRTLGYLPILKSDHPPRLKDVLILWNRYPRDEYRARLYEARGNHVIYHHPEAYAVVQALKARGVVGDFRMPDCIRLGIAPIYLSYQDIGNAVAHLRAVMEGREWAEPSFRMRATVT